MKDDKTPTITARRRQLTPHMRLRVENAKKLEKLGARAKAMRDQLEKGKRGEDDPESLTITTKRAPKTKENTLNEPAKPQSKFRKRQINKSWLPTHLYHAKRAHISAPKEPMWRFAIPLTPTEKSYRATHRAGQTRGCVAWDLSYMSTIGLEGVEGSLLGLMRSLSVPEDMLTAKKGQKWRRGVRFWCGWVRERDADQGWITTTEIVWCVAAKESQGKITEDDAHLPRAKKTKRKALFRVHPGAFLQLWNEVLKVAKIQKPAVMVEDLRFEIGSIEITGPGSTEALVGILQPITNQEDALPDDPPTKLWSSLSSVSNPASLPVNALLGFEISDPRLRHPPRTVKNMTSNDDLIQLLSSWPPDFSQGAPSLFDSNARRTASRLLPSQKSINRRKGDALAGEYPPALTTDPQIPILLLASRPENKGGQGSWVLLLPWKCVLPVWYSLMYYPLSSGSNPRFGGLQEKRQNLFEQGTPWFPGDFHGTKAGWQWELGEREKRKADWEKRPKGKRIEWESVDLGSGRRGEIGRGWACDWERLFLGPSAVSNPEVDCSTEAPTTSSLKLDTLPFPQSGEIPPSISPTVLISVTLTCLHRGIPVACARIYRLPTTDPSLREQWLALASTTPKKQRKEQDAASFPRLSTDAPDHEKREALAKSLLASQHAAESPRTGRNPPLQADDPAYPPVPEEEDLIGFVTTGNFNLGEGRGMGIGCIAAARVLDELRSRRRGGFCVVREAGMGLGRIARWAVV